MRAAQNGCANWVDQALAWPQPRRTRHLRKVATIENIQRIECMEKILFRLEQTSTDLEDADPRHELVGSAHLAYTSPDHDVGVDPGWGDPLTHHAGNTAIG